MRVEVDLSKREAEALLRGPDYYAAYVLRKSNARRSAEMKVLQAVTRAWNETVARTSPRAVPLHPQGEDGRP